MGEKHQCVVASHMPQAGDLAHNPGMCPDWESNRRPFGSQACTQSTELHQPGQFSCILNFHTAAALVGGKGGLKKQGMSYKY